MSDKNPEDTIDKAVVEKKSTLPAILPKRLYLILEGRSTFDHSGRSRYASKQGGYRFVLGGAIVINHPIDIEYFISKRKQFNFLVMIPSNAKGAPRLPKGYENKHLIVKFADVEKGAAEEAAVRYARLL